MNLPPESDLPQPVSPAAPAQQLPLLLSTPELAVIFQHLLPPGSPLAADLLGDLDVDAAQLAEARVRLVARGLLLVPPRRAESVLAPSLQPLFSAVTQPDALSILQITRPDQPERRVYFGWQPGQLACNSLDEHGTHSLTPLDSLEQLSALALRECGLEQFTPSAASQPPDPQSVARAASLRAVFLSVANLRGAREEVTALSWLVSYGQVWLLARGGGSSGRSAAADGEAITFQPVTVERLGEAIRAAAGEAIRRTL